MRSGLNETISELLFIERRQYFIYGDSAYNQRPFMEVPFQGSNLAEERHEFNKAMPTVHVTVK